MIKVLVTGSRYLTNDAGIRRAFISVAKKARELDCSVTVISGGAKGADALADSLARDVFGFNVETFQADWSNLGKKAGPVRNQAMVDSKPNICFAFPLDNSYGTWDCINRARKASIPTYVYNEETETFTKCRAM